MAPHAGQDTTRVLPFAAISARSCLAVVVSLLLGMTVWWRTHRPAIFAKGRDGT